MAQSLISEESGRFSSMSDRLHDVSSDSEEDISKEINKNKSGLFSYQKLKHKVLLFNVNY